MTKHDELVALLTEIRDRLPEPEGVNESIPTRERPSAGDPDEALAKVIFKAFSGSSGREVDDTGPGWRAVARAARERIAEEGPLAGELDAAVWHRQFEKEKARAEKAEAERDGWRADAVNRKRVVDSRGEQIASLTERNVDLTRELRALKDRAETAEAERDQHRAVAEARRKEKGDLWARVGEVERHARDVEAERDDATARAESWRDANSGIHAERDAALDEVKRLRAKHAALREDVEALRDNYGDQDCVIHPHSVARHVRWDVLDRDAERTPQADPDTVTLRRDDVIELAEVWEQYAAGLYGFDTTARVRAALGWGDSDDT